VNDGGARIRVVFLIRSLNVGGAERQLLTLATGLSRSRFEVTVATFYPEGSMHHQFGEEMGVPVVALEKRGRWDLAAFSFRLWKALRGWRPHVLQCYLTEPNLLGLMVGRAAGVPKVVWGIRASNMDYSHYDRAAGWTFRLAARLSRLPDLIVANSDAGRRHHVAQGYSAERMTVVANGIDVARLRPDPEAGRRLREEWGIGPRACLIGIVARLDPMKGHETFLRAAAQLGRRKENARFVCVGDGAAGYKAALARLAADLGLGTGRITWAGHRPDVRAVYSALDIACLSSRFGEGFPNVVGESMACGTPCVVTDVGDAALIVGDTGMVVPPESPEALASAWGSLLDLGPAERVRLGQKARQRIVEHFDTGRLVEGMSRVYETLVSGDAPDAAR
jgi:glycosyltransferase involved in cell wall biosynthesis